MILVALNKFRIEFCLFFSHVIQYTGVFKSNDSHLSIYSVATIHFQTLYHAHQN